MMTFEDFYNKLIDSKGNLKFKVSGLDKSIKGMAEFKTVNMGEDGYMKLMFTDGSFMLLVPSITQIFYAEKILGKIETIDDKDIGVKETIEFNSKVYKLENPNDFQYVIHLYKGGPDDIEGEVKFSDYAPINGDPEILSLGWLTRTNERADINCHDIKLTEIEYA